MNKVQFYILIGVLLCPLISTVSVASIEVHVAARDPMSVQTKKRLNHAKELLGKRYQKSAVKKSESTGDISEFIKSATHQFLPKAFRKSSDEIAQAILES